MKLRLPQTEPSRAGKSSAQPLMLLACLIGAIVYFIFFTPQGQNYILDHPSNLLWIGGVALVGGLLSATFQRMPQAVRNRFLLCARLGLVVAYAALLVLIVCRSAPWSVMVLCLALLGYSVLRLYLTWKHPR